MTAIALTIAGSDSGGGAGIQADLKTFSALGAYGASVLTAVTAQNTMGVSAVEDISPAMIAAQMQAVFSDLAVNAVKIGMVSRSETIGVIADGLAAYRGPLVVDPVMVATSGDRLLQEEAIETLIARLLPLATLVTPNLPEAALLTGREIAHDQAEMIDQARIILGFGAGAVLIKGGHGSGAESTDLLVTGHSVTEFSALRIETRNDHGTGCTLAAAVTAALGRGLPLPEACRAAKAYLHAALDAGRALKVGKGLGPVHHFHAWWAP
ncbi:bifunctional hydroxymethylpyrimidine kinase/phosphomethylpyrimidine kinase [Rhizobium sp. FY34]|uniref:bifunctional hydroxymethylpyrimidine kinase/phosphomethylpyrimidine kinase n=1 Tax=Rhizobium sp. FY34 TaxID=2562309 RepID=UPI0010C08DDF|nr:bifunctional hydroxymethylpyrimidine kinase/phosphomethylpyrimidine kinase [Rhizobium sp. FY34]